MDPTIILTNGAASSFTSVDASTVVSSGSRSVTIIVQNKSDFPTDFHYRKTGGSEIAPISIIEGRISSDIRIVLDGTNINFDYYVTDGASIDIYVVDYTSGTTSASTTYCTAAQVSSFMGLPTFTALTTPNLAEVNDIIESVCDEIDQFTHHCWRTVRVTDEYYTAAEWTPMTDGLGDWSDRSRIYLIHRKIHQPMIALDCFDGNNWVNFVTQYNEARYGDYWLDYDRGIIHFANRYPLRRRHAVKVTYDYGDTTVPADIKNAAVMLVCYQLLQRDDRSILLPEGTSNISPQSKSEMWYQRAYRLLARHIEIISYQ